MCVGLTRRGVLGGTVASSVTWRLAHAADDTLARLRHQKKAKVALADNPPYSGLAPDGSITGIAPTVVKIILGRLDIPEVEGAVAPYGQLIPGLQAGRWDIIAACLTITKERCQEVAYADPIVADGGVFIYVPADLPNPPRSVADLASMGLTVITSQGSYAAKRSMNAGVPVSKIIQVPDTSAEIDAVAARRGQVAYTAYYGAIENLRERQEKFKLVYPLPDDQSHGSSCAFRRTDESLRSAFQQELRAMKQSGEFQKISEQFRFPPTDQVLHGTAEEECNKAT
jgi:polar amino acid transport system substrate-binding protein